jgi:hypothetical protein
MSDLCPTCEIIHTDKPKIGNAADGYKICPDCGKDVWTNKEETYYKNHKGFTFYSC